MSDLWQKLFGRESGREAAVRSIRDTEDNQYLNILHLHFVASKIHYNSLFTSVYYERGTEKHQFLDIIPKEVVERRRNSEAASN